MAGPLKHLSIFKKMLIAPTVGTMLFLLFLLLVYYQHNLGKATFQSIESTELPQLKLAERNLIYLDTIRNDLEDAVSAGEPSWIENTLRYQTLIGDNFVQLREFSAATEQINSLNTIEQHFQLYFEKAVELSRALLQDNTQLSNARIGMMIDEMREQRALTEQDFKSLIAKLESTVTYSLDRTQALLDRLLFLGALLGVFAVVTMGIISMRIALPTRRALNNVVHTVETMAKGEPDFTHRIVYDAKDEVGDVVRQFNRFTDNLQDIYRRLEKSSKQSEHSLQEFKALINATIEGIVVVKDNICIDVNDSGMHMFGSDDRSEIVGQPMIRFIAPESHPTVAKHMHEAKTIPYEIILYRHNGSTFPALVQGYDLDTADGIKRISAIIDLSETKEKERLLEAQKDLALEAQQEAIEATRAKSTFLANMSHEIRTPMNGIIGMTYLAMKSGLDEKQHHYIQQIDTAAKSLLGIINDLLDVSKIEAGKLELEYIDFDIGETIERLIGLLRPRADEKGLELTVSMQTLLRLRAHGDPLRLGQILTNLISNAVKFTEEGSVRIHVSQFSNTGYRFEVIDTGIGMSAEQLQSIFTPFTQADGSITRRFGGTGLGLSITKQLCEMMQGEIRVESSPGKGSRFIVEVTLNEPITAVTKAEESVVDTSTMAAHRVLLVEDNAMNREIAREMLYELGLEVDEAVNGENALVLYDADPKRYGLILMDIQMPGMDGYACTRALRKRGATLPIIALSANAMQEHIKASHDAGMNDHIAKPIDFVILRRTLSHSLQVKALQSTEPPAPAVSDTIDFARGLYHVNGNEALYAKTVRSFLTAYTHPEETLVTMDDDARAKWLHTQKGLAGTVGATALQSAVATYEENNTPETKYRYLEANAEAITALETSPFNLSSTQEETLNSLTASKEAELLDALCLALVSQQPAKIRPLTQQLDKAALSSKTEPRYRSAALLIGRYRYKEALELLKERS